MVAFAVLVQDHRCGPSESVSACARRDKAARFSRLSQSESELHGLHDLRIRTSNHSRLNTAGAGDVDSNVSPSLQTKAPGSCELAVLHCVYCIVFKQ